MKYDITNVVENNPVRIMYILIARCYVFAKIIEVHYISNSTV